ncbi:MAG: ABC transporter ATP-binding protein [Erysipelothrix sp.]|nr:ABC transporter ATP-binding protein [Erysipelothrix sp.]
MLRKFMAYYKPYKKLFFIDMFAALVMSLIDLITPQFTSYFIDELIPKGSLSLIYRYLFFLAIAYLIHVICGYVVEYWGHVMGVGIEYDMRKEMFDHMQTLPVEFYDNVQTGKLMSRLVGDLNEISEAAHHGPENVVLATTVFIGSFIMMFITSWQLTLILLAFVPIMFVIAINRNMKFRNAFREMRKKIAQINAQAENNFSGIRVVKAFNGEELEIEAFNEGNQNFADTRKVALKTMAEFGVSVKTFIYSTQIIVFIAGSYLVLNGQLEVGQLVAFLLYVQLFRQPVDRTTQFLLMFNQAMSGFERFLEVLDIPAQQDKEGALEVKQLNGHIRYENVGFAYESNKEKQVLDNIDFEVLPNKTIAFVGPSGGGKSTLCNLLVRFYELDEGRISIDDIDITDMTIQSLRHHVGIVSQDVFIFAGSAKDNILYGKPDASDDEVIEAAKKAQAYDFISELPYGFDTDIGERGAKLSGGQKQRIALARIFLKNPQILILDEATSALDNQTEIEIQETLNKLSQDRTTLVVAHRLSTIRHADEICVVTQEGIVERGNHDTLMERQGLYYQLINTQQDFL